MHEQTLEKTYYPGSVEPGIYAKWEQSGAFTAKPDGRPHARTYTIVIPPPNVTGALHLGHALNNTLQDILVRYHRMRGFNTLWQPGTDHAGIATQAVVERRIREQEGKTRYQLGATEQEARAELVRRIWQWKDEYEKRIISQLKLMGCSCDWSRNRFTLDEGLARAVRHMFFMLFRDGLIFRGKRLVNWDTQLQTAVSDDEVYYETVKGHFWHFKYPIVQRDQGIERSRDQGGGGDQGIEGSRDQGYEPQFVVIATTRPETMLGDTAVAVHPDPEDFFIKREAELRADLDVASAKDKTEIQAKLDKLAERRVTHLPTLIALRDMAKAGRQVRLPLTERVIPLIMDEWADPTLGTGCVKITPAHDPNDYQVWQRHPEIGAISVLSADGRVAPIIEPNPAAAPCKPGTSENAHSHEHVGLAFNTEGRAKVVADMEARGLIDHVEDRDIELGHSDRSKLPIEPYLSDQWFVKTGDDANFKISNLKSEISDIASAKGLAQAAMDAVENSHIRVFPQRYAKSYLDWLGEKRDWCISRQLWWGHRIPIWAKQMRLSEFVRDATFEPGRTEDESLSHLFDIATGASSTVINVEEIDGSRRWANVAALHGSAFLEMKETLISEDPLVRITLCPAPSASPSQRGIEDYIEAAKGLGFDAEASDIEKMPGAERTRQYAEDAGLNQDSDVLDTWFSSALWPFSTLGWPEKTEHLKQYYPGSVLCTSRDIITNWVARMVMFGLYAMGEVPFDHVYIHPKILDGRGETMSKSKGNGVDPVDIIHTHGADAMRYTLADMTTETQDIRMPVEYVCPHCGTLIDQALALKNEEQSRKSRGIKLDRKLQPSDVTRVTCTNKECGRAFATQWADAALKQELGLGRETSDKFDIGRNFCNKLWNAARFAFMNLEGEATERRSDEATKGKGDRGAEGARDQEEAALPSISTASRRWAVADGSERDWALRDLLPEDRWILARLSQTIRRYHELVANYQFAASVKELRDFFWDSLCDWYLELTKPRFGAAGAAVASETAADRKDELGITNYELQGKAGLSQSTIDNGQSTLPSDNRQSTIARQVLAFCLDQALRLWHPTIPFITERLWQQLNNLVPERGIEGIAELKCDTDLIAAQFPPVEGYPALDDEKILATFASLQDAVRGVRDLRSSANVPPKDRPTVTVVVPKERLAVFQAQAHIVRHMAGIGTLHVVSEGKRPRNAGCVSMGAIRIFVHDISDDEAERTRCTKTLEAVEKQIAGKQSKLSNEKFVANAKPEVVDAERQRLSELLAERTSLTAHLRELAE